MLKCRGCVVLREVDIGGLRGVGVIGISLVFGEVGSGSFCLFFYVEFCV